MDLMNKAWISFITHIVYAQCFKLRYPFKITWALTYTCNACCKMCKTWQREKQDELKLNDIERIYNTMPSGEWIQLTGGELFVREDIDDILSFFMSHKKCAFLSLPTNGLLTEKILGVVESVTKKNRGKKYGLSV